MSNNEAPEHPKDPANGRWLCTPEHPYNPDLDGVWAHRDTHEVGEQEDGWPGGDIITIECRTCGIKWKQELPQ